MPTYKVAIEGVVYVKADNFREACYVLDKTGVALEKNLEALGEYADIYIPEPELQEEEED
jgi:hypothetical protein